MRTYDLDGNSGCIATVFDYDVFTREENYIRLHRNDTSIATYAIDNEVHMWYGDDVEIEVSDLLRTKAQVDGVLLTFNERTTVITFSQWDGVSPESSVLLPPSVLPQPPSSIGYFYVEFYYGSTFSTDAVTAVSYQGGGVASTKSVDAVGDFGIPITPSALGYEIIFSTLNVGQEISPAVLERYNLEAVSGGYRYRIGWKPMECDREYVRVRWVGRHGLLKDWLYEVVSRSTAADSVITLATADNNTRTRKHGYGVSIETVARDMKGIDIYYLNDIAESNDVKIYNELTHSWEACAVSESKATGTTERGDLTVNFNLKTYVR